jgi:hypothetical protein
LSVEECLGTLLLGGNKLISFWKGTWIDFGSWLDWFGKRCYKGFEKRRIVSWRGWIDILLLYSWRVFEPLGSYRNFYLKSVKNRTINRFILFDRPPEEDQKAKSKRCKQGNPKVILNSSAKNMNNGRTKGNRDK